MRVFQRALALLALLATSSCSSDSERPITVRGSDTMVAIGQKWAEIYMAKNPEATIQVNGGGSGTGISALINRIADICQSSRPMKKRERDIIKHRYGRDAIEIPVAKDGIVIYVHESNPISELSIAQMKAIYTGKIRNWKELGWEDRNIVVYGRENSSGTYEFFKKRVLNGEDFAADVQTLPGTGAIANAVAQDKYSIGYGGIAYSRGIKFLAAKETDDSPAVAASEQTIADNSYPIARDLYFYLVKEPKGRTKDFIDWVLSDEGQSLAIEEGYFPVRPLAKTENSATVLAK
ncbi:MAG: phosphate ABC transporter substrate-binding protein [Chloroherpetonaceae bacterium]|nr:phosphate ABC transporter substrate-binding protein [Chloroherpetonaceae bacterium]MDW8437366.1 phosphate ABC transporter substrate-binding protein [Chloroherpetonaceae bacterium]